MARDAGAGATSLLHGDLTPLCRLAEGGMGYVDVAVLRDGAFRRLYAVKRPHLDARRDAMLGTMLQEEARLAGLIRHPNVVSVLAVGQDDTGPFLVMDYIDGVSLAAVLAGASPRDAPLPLALCLEVAAQAARGLHAAHEVTGDDGRPLGLVHRDVSPQNILLGFDGVARVTDFGIAKALGNLNRTSTGVLRGNLGYMAPEQLRFRPSDRRADVFALGVVLYELLTRQRLYGGDDADEVARRILEEPPPDVGEHRNDIPPELSALMFELLAKEATLRPPDAAAVARRLETLARPLLGLSKAFDAEAWMAAHFGELRVQRSRQIEQALAAQSSLPDATPPRRGRVRIVGAAVAALTLVGAAAAWIATRAPAGTPPSSSPRIFAGAWHTCAASDGAFHCWGKNGDGQLGDGQTADQSIPRRVNGLPGRVVAAAGGSAHTCVVIEDGRVFCWGSNTVGQVGPAGGRGAWEPVPFPLPAPARALAAGSTHTCALAAGRVFCWGDNALAQLGSDSPAPFRMTAEQVPGLEQIDEVAAGPEATCARGSTRAIRCWGNLRGILGPSDGDAPHPHPTPVAGLPPLVGVAVGRSFACGLTGTGQVHCLGANHLGQLGRGSVEKTRGEVARVPGISEVVEVRAGGSFACARVRSGAVHCWGRSDLGNIGAGSSATASAVPSPLAVADLEGATALALGYQHACAASDRRILCWGLNETGQLGDGTRTNRSRLVTVAGGF